MYCCATTAASTTKERRLRETSPPKHASSPLKKRRPTAPCSPEDSLAEPPPLLAAFINRRSSSRGSSYPDTRTVLPRLVRVPYGKSAVAARSATCTWRCPTSPAYRTLCPSITERSCITGRLSLNCKTCCTASETQTSWT